MYLIPNGFGEMKDYRSNLKFVLKLSYFLLSCLTYASGGDCILLPLSSPGTMTPAPTHW